MVVFPLASSISPKSGDTNLMSALIRSEDANDDGNKLTFRRLLRGNDEWCFALLTDSGYEHDDFKVFLKLFFILHNYFQVNF